MLYKDKEVAEAYQKAYQKEYRAANKEIIAEKQKEYRAANKEAKAAYDKIYREKNLVKIKNYKAEYIATHKQEKKEYDINRRKIIGDRYDKNKQIYHLKNKYNLTIDEFYSMVSEQNNRCWICCCEFNSTDNRPHIDHLHRDGTVRALLCRSCNSALGMAKDNIKIVLKMAQYLTEKGSEHDIISDLNEKGN